MFDPRPNEPLCSAIRSRDLLAVRHEIDELQTKHPTDSFSIAMVTAIHEMNLEALGDLLKHGHIDEDVASAAASSEDTQIVQRILDHGWDIDRPLCGGQIPSMLRYSPNSP